MIINLKRIFNKTPIEIPFLMLFLPYSIFLFSSQAWNISIKIILLTFFSLGICITEVLLLYKKRLKIRNKLIRIDLIEVIFLFITIFQFFISSAADKTEYYILIAMSFLLYFGVSLIRDCTQTFENRYIDYILVSTAVVYIMILIRYLAFSAFLEPIKLLVDNQDAMLSFLVLTTAIATMQYCSNNKKQKDRFYLPLAGIGYFLLFLQKDSISILLCGMLFLVIPMIYSPTAELIKRNLILCFLYFFILSNMPLLTNYTNLLQIEVSFELTNSIYLDLAIAIAGVFVFQYWERVPKDIPLNRIIMHKFQRAIQFIFKVVCILLAVILCTGNLDTLPEKFGISMLKNIASTIKTDIAQSSGTFQQTLEGYGIIGFILVIILFSMIIRKLKRNYRSDNKTAMLTIITILFMVQSLFYRQQSVTTPIYAILVTFAIFNEKSKEESHETTKQYTKERITDDKRVEYISSNSNDTVTS